MNDEPRNLPKLSEATRLGALLGPPIHGILWDGRTGSCALGAALLAISDERRNPWTLTEQGVATFFPLLAMRPPWPPCECRLAYGGPDATVAYWMAHLYESSEHRWSREQVADWVAAVEAEMARRVAGAWSAECIHGMHAACTYQDCECKCHLLDELLRQQPETAEVGA